MNACPPATRYAYEAVSKAAQELSRLEAVQKAHTQERTVFADLKALWEEASHDQWAGREGVALLPGAYWKAREFLEAIALIGPPPELTVDNFGAVEMDWMPARRKRLSVSLDVLGNAVYAFRLDERSSSGSEPFRDGKIPEILARLIADVTKAPTA